MDIYKIDDENIWELFNDNCKIKSSSVTKCIFCDSEFLINDKGNVVCKECGTINAHIFDQNPEWIHNDDGRNDDSVRCGAPINYFLPNSSLSTTIVGGGNGCYKLKKLHSWGQQPYKERSRSDVMQLIDEKCKLNNIGKAVAENAKYLYKKISEIKHKNGINEGKIIIIRGKNRKSIIAACVLFETFDSFNSFLRVSRIS
jgi:transcription initiation factor TFIIIB Brf1 subunit/transcription initiation factor TFIIB